LSRHRAARPIPTLLAKNGEPFTYTLPDELLRLNDDLTRGASGQIAISEQMILNNYVAMRRVVELRHEELTPDLVSGHRNGLNPRFAGSTCLFRHRPARRAFGRVAQPAVAPPSMFH
jgi:hypothetical protein